MGPNYQSGQYQVLDLAERRPHQLSRNTANLTAIKLAEVTGAGSDDVHESCGFMQLPPLDFLLGL